MRKFASFFIAVAMLLAVSPTTEVVSASEANAPASLSQSTSQVTASTATSATIAWGAKLYKTYFYSLEVKYRKATTSTQRRAILATIKKVYSYRTTAQRRALRAYMNSVARRTYASSGSGSSTCVPNRICPLAGVRVISSTTRQLATYAIGSCWEYTVQAAEVNTVWVVPLVVKLTEFDMYRFQVQVTWCSDGSNITYIDPEARSISALPAFFFYKGTSGGSMSTPATGWSFTTYSVQATYSYSPPPFEGLIVNVDFYPFIKVTVHADGTATANEVRTR